MNRQPTSSSFAHGMKLFDESQKAFAASEAVRRNKYSFLMVLYDRLKLNEPIDHVMETLACCERDEQAALQKWQELDREFQDALKPTGAEVAA